MQAARHNAGQQIGASEMHKLTAIAAYVTTDRPQQTTGL